MRCFTPLDRVLPLEKAALRKCSYFLVLPFVGDDSLTPEGGLCIPTLERGNEKETVSRGKK